ncbi:hypothetical protein ADUPG1_009730, partial [Aduncisulcus paluster]
MMANGIIIVERLNQMFSSLLQASFVVYISYVMDNGSNSLPRNFYVFLGFILTVGLLILYLFSTFPESTTSINYFEDLPELSELTGSGCYTPFPLKICNPFALQDGYCNHYTDLHVIDSKDSILSFSSVSCGSVYFFSFVVNYQIKSLSFQPMSKLKFLSDHWSSLYLAFKRDHSNLSSPLSLLLVSALFMSLVFVGLVLIVIFIFFIFSIICFLGNRMRSISPSLIFLVVLSVSLPFVLGFGFSEECAMYISGDDHLECNEVYPGRYAPECIDGYYYDQGEYSCVEDNSNYCPNDMNDHQMCVKTTGDTISSDCRSAWYGVDCDQLYSVHIPDILFRGRICAAAGYTVDACDVTVFEMAEISAFWAGNIHIKTLEGAQHLLNVYLFNSINSDITGGNVLASLGQLTNLYPGVDTGGICPSIVRNEVYNSLDGINAKECASIAKTSGSVANNDLTCYTVHDDSIRDYLITNCLSTGALDSGIISVATMRSVLSCLDPDNNESLSIPSIASSRLLSSVNSITTLQGLEYATSLKFLTLDGYDLSGNVNANAEYDKLVVQILAKAVDFGSFNSGLTFLSANDCGLSAISDILDLTPIHSEDIATRPFKLSSLWLSNNSISDVSVLITEPFFPENVLSSLDISGNNICDIDTVTSALILHFTNLSSSNILSSSQSSCPCTDLYPLSFSKHRTCRKTSAGVYRVECWNGYYWDKNSSTCIEATSDNDKLRCQVCERNGTVPTVYMDSSEILCGICGLGYHGDTCEYVDIPDSNLRSALCLAVTNPSAHDSSCDDLTIADMATVTSVSASLVDSFEGLQHAVNLTSLSISGTSSSSVSIGNTDLAYLPLSLTDLTLEAVYLDADSDFTSFTNITTLSLKNNSSYDLTNSALFPSTSTFTSLDVSYTALSSFSSIPTSITTLTANNCSSLTSFSTISNLTNLVSLDVSYASNVSDFSSLLSNIPLSTSILYANGCNVAANTDFSTFTALTTLSLNGNTDYDITESGLFPSTTTFTSFSANNTSISLLFHLVASMPNLTELSLNNNNISDPSPLYALSSSSLWDSIDLSNNAICEDGIDDALNVLNNIFTSSPDIVISVGTQDCHCSTDNPSLSDNKVCDETKPGSGVWYVVCASNSYTSYTSAEDFTCISPGNVDGTYGCSGGCEYGQECRYDSTSTSTSCQQVIVDENLHDCVADMFGANDYLHRTEDVPSLFSVASLKTLVTTELSDGTFVRGHMYYNHSSNFITSLSGIEHLAFVTYIFIRYFDILNDNHVNLLSTLTNLKYLYLYSHGYGSSSFSLPDFPNISGLETLYLNNSIITFPSDELLIANCNISQAGFEKNVGSENLSNLEELYMRDTSLSLPSGENILASTITILDIYATLIDQDGFDGNIGNNHLPYLELLYFGGEYNTVTSIESLSSASTLTEIVIYYNPDITSLAPLAEMGLYSLITLNFGGCSISDLSPLYDFPEINGVNFSSNNICFGNEGSSELQNKFSQSSNINPILGSQTCECSSDDLGPTPIIDNIVCSETKPGSGAWYVVCASNSYTSYTSAEDFTCISPGNVDGTYGCSGGCEYGQECRYDSDLNSTSCQQVIVDENLHDCVANMFGTDSNGDPIYTHRTDSTPSLFSVASLHTLESMLDSETGESSPFITCSDSSVSDVSGVEHLGKITEFSLDNNLLSDVSNLSLLSTLSSLTALYLSENASLSTLPDLSSVSLVSLGINGTSIALSDTSDSTLLIPDSLVQLRMYDTPTVQAGFDTQVGSSHLSGLKM